MKNIKKLTTSVGKVEVIVDFDQSLDQAFCRGKAGSAEAGEGTLS